MLAIAIAAIAITTSSSAFAYHSDPSIQDPNYTPERHADMEKAFANNDYDVWVKLMEGRGRVTSVINADNFARFAEAHKLAEEGQLDKAKSIRLELGLGLRDGSGHGKRHSHRGNRYGPKDGSGAMYNNR